MNGIRYDNLPILEFVYLHFLQISYFETFLKAMAVSVVVTPTIC